MPPSENGQESTLNLPVRLRSGAGRYTLCVGRDLEIKMLPQNLRGFQGRALLTDPRGN